MCIATFLGGVGVAVSASIHLAMDADKRGWRAGPEVKRRAAKAGEGWPKAGKRWVEGGQMQEREVARVGMDPSIRAHTWKPWQLP